MKTTVLISIILMGLQLHAGAEDQVLNYAWVATNVIGPKCTGCHNSVKPAGGLSLETYEDVQAHAQAIHKAVQSGEMPMMGSLSVDEKDSLLRWIEIGLPQ